jgi:hypothetical protein
MLIDARVVAKSSAIALIALASATLGSGAQKPVFSDFPTPVVAKKNPPAKPLLRTSIQRRFEAQIRSQAVLPPNFAGHYRIAEWGCGSSCVSIAVINLENGEVSDGPFKLLGYGRAYKYEGGSDALEYRVWSRLLVARGCPEDKNCGTYYYEWKDGHFDRIRFVVHGPLL